MFGPNNKLNEVSFTIERLGAIENSKIVLKQFMILSGESGVGKSYVAMMVNYIFHILWSDQRLNNFFKENNYSFNEMRKTWKNKSNAFSFRKKELQNWLNKDVVNYLKYMTRSSNLNAKIKIELPIPDVLHFDYIEEISGLVDAADAYFRLNINDELYFLVKNEDESIERESCFSFLLRYYLIKCIFDDHKGFRYNYILPPSRGAAMTENVKPETGLFQSFMDTLDEINTASPNQDNIDEHLLAQFKKILDGRVYKDKASGLCYYETNGANMPISAAASSVKEIAPLSLFINRFDISYASILMEEPEAHLHPLKQRMMADILSLLVDNNACIQITTHSDYLLRRINELVNLYKISQLHKNDFDEACKDIGIESYLAIDYNKIGAYLLKRNSQGKVSVECQNTFDGIKFDSFYSALRENIDNRGKIDKWLAV